MLSHNQHCSVAARRPFVGATLAELLIALYILGLLSVYTIPRVLTAQNNAREKAVFRESIAAAQLAITLSRRLGDIPIGHYPCGTGRPNTPDLTLIGARLNYIRKGEGGPTKMYWLPNGAKISFFLGGHLDTTVDINGDDGPNLHGQDRVIFYFTDCQGTQGGIPTGKFGLHPTLPALWAENKALWESIFSSG